MKVLCVLYDDPKGGMPKSYPLSELPKIEKYPDGMTLPCKMDTSNGQIFIYEESSHSGQEQQGKMNQGSEFVRKELAKKFSSMG